MRSRSNEPAIPFDFPELLFWIARMLVYALILFVPWPYGMVEWSWQAWLVPVACLILLLTACGALMRGMSHAQRLIWPLMVILIVSVIQTVALPESLWRVLSQTADFENKVEVLAAEFAVDTDGPRVIANSLPALYGVISPPRTISIHPLQTRATACVFAAGVAILISASLLFRDRLSLAGLYLALTVSGVSISLLGLYQSISKSDWTLLPNMLPTSFATFIGRNSVPQFLACTLAGVAGLLTMYASYRKKSTSDRRYQIKYPSVNLFAKARRRIDDFVSDVDVVSAVCLVAMIVIAVSILVAKSRGGIVGQRHQRFGHCGGIPAGTQSLD